MRGLWISSGGTQNTSSSTWSYVNSGVTSNGVVLGELDRMYVYSGGTANNTTVNADGTIYMLGGTVNGTIVNSDGELLLNSGIANSTTVNLGVMTAESGTTADNTTVKGTQFEFGYVYINAGVSGNGLNVNYGGRAEVAGEISNTVVNANGVLTLSAGSIETLTVNSAGMVKVLDGATVSGAAINSFGELDLSNAAMEDVAVAANGYMVVSNSAAVSNASIAGSMYIAADGSLNEAVVTSGGSLRLTSGGKASDVSVEADGTLRVSAGAVVSALSMDGGEVHVSAGANIREAELNGGIMNVSSTGTVRNVAVNKDAVLSVLESGVVSSATVNNGGKLQIAEGGSGMGVTLNEAGTLEIASGAVVNNLILESGAKQTVSAGALAQRVTVNADAGMEIWENGAVNYVIANEAGRVDIASGASVTEVKENGGYVSVEDGADVTFVANTVRDLELANESATAHSGTVMSNAVLKEGGELYLYDGGIARKTTVDANGKLVVYDGGTASAAVINTDGGIYVSEGGVAEKTSVFYDGYMHIYDGGAANNTVMSRGSMHISEGGIASQTLMDYGCCMNVSNGGSAVETTVNSWCSMYLESGAQATDTNVNSMGSMFISNGGVASDVTVAKYGDLYVYNGGVVSEVGIQSAGKMVVSGGTVKDTVIIGGSMYLSSDAVHSGMLQFSGDSVVSAEEGAVIDFTVAEATPTSDSGYLVGNLSMINGAPSYTITVAEDQQVGTYKLASGAEALTDEVITIKTDNEVLGTISVNEALTTSNYNYTLTLDSGVLSFTVSVIPDTPEPPTVTLTAVGNFTGKGGIFTLMSDNTYTVTTTDGPEISNIANVEGLELIGVGDYNGDGKDGLLWLQTDTGVVFMQDDVSSFATISAYRLGILGEGYEIRGTGDFSGSGIDGVVMRGPEFGDPSISENHGLLVWARDEYGHTFNGWLGALVNTWKPGEALEGDTSDLADINAKNYMYDIVGVGDFNGDGVDDVLIQNVMPETVDGIEITGAGDVFTFLTGDVEAIKDGADPTVAYSGRATDGWEILGSGDFDGDGIDDVLLSDGSGVAAWKMAEGQRTEDMWLGSLADGMEVLGIADCNADGIDDIVLQNASTDEQFAWLIKDNKISETVAIA